MGANIRATIKTNSKALTSTSMIEEEFVFADMNGIWASRMTRNV